VTQGKLFNSLVELETELLAVSSYDTEAGTAVCPPWFRQQSATPANDSFPVGSRVTINPLWPTFNVAQTIVDGINGLYPDLFAAKATQLTSEVTRANYELPSDVDGLLKVSIQDFGPSKMEYKLGRWALDTLNPDGKKYLRIVPIGIGGRPMEITYRAKPVVPAPETLSATWASTGLPDSASDLPVLHALSTLVPSAEAAKMQTYSVEQSDRSRLVQAGAGTSLSRRYTELYQARLEEERRKLRAVYPPRIHKSLNG
jgi:hypothetical protein